MTKVTEPAVRIGRPTFRSLDEHDHYELAPAVPLAPADRAPPVDRRARPIAAIVLVTAVALASPTSRSWPLPFPTSTSSSARPSLPCRGCSPATRSPSRSPASPGSCCCGGSAARRSRSQVRPCSPPRRSRRGSRPRSPRSSPPAWRRESVARRSSPARSVCSSPSSATPVAPPAGGRPRAWPVPRSGPCSAVRSPSSSTGGRCSSSRRRSR